MIPITSRPRNLSIAATVCGAILFVVSLIIRNNGNCSAMVPAVMAAAITVLMGLVSTGRTIFQRRQEQEEQDAAEYHRQHGSAELFGDADEAVRLATRSNQQYVKYFVPAITILMGIVLGLFVLIYWLRWRGAIVNTLAERPLPMAILSFCCCIATLVAGSFFIGVSRENGCRWIRPAAAWLILSGVLCLLGSAVMFCEHFQSFAENADPTFAKIGLVVVGILAIELILAFVIEFYRPRMPGEQERPLAESRLLALFTEPGGVARNVAASLDYQFGFRVSEVWFYRFLERTMVPLLMVMVLVFWLMSCIVVVNPSETALRERFGKVVSEEPFGPGVYFKLPYPFESIYRFTSSRVQELTIENSTGAEDHEEEEEEEEDEGHGHSHERPGKKKKKAHDDDHAGEPVILWNMEKSHKGEADYLVGAKSVEKITLEGNVQDSQGVGLLAAHIPLFFKVNDLYKYTYNNRDTARILKNIGQRELLEYFIQTDWNDLLGAGRGKASEILRGKIQERADSLGLGVEIVFVALTGLHPPVGVGASFDRITAATVDRQKLVQAARTDANRTLSIANTAVRLIGNSAESYRVTQVAAAEADGGRFASQLLCYKASPSQYMLNSYYEVFAGAGANARKFVVTGNAKDQVLWLNLERKARSNLLDLNLGGEL